MRLAHLIGPELRDLLRNNPAEVSELLDEVHAEDLADVVQELDDDEAAELLRRMSADDAADIFERLPEGRQEALVEKIGLQPAARIAGEMAADDRADLFSALPEEVGDQLLETLERVDPEAAEEVEELSKWPDGAIMTPYIGSHDTARFVTLAQYGAGSGIPGNQWDDTAVAPTTQDPYEKMRVGMAWLLTLPGAPLLYYGDEYGQWGGSDPNNRLMWRDGSALDANEAATLAFVRKVGSARRELPALRRGDYVKLYATEDSLVFARKMASGNAAIVALTRSGSPVPVTVELTTSLGFISGTTLQDRIGGPSVSVAANGTASFSIPGKGASILAP